MSILARIRFLCGMIVVLVIVGLLTLYLNAMLSTVHATQAQLSADTVTVGVDYPGQVASQSVAVGQKVVQGQSLYTVVSPQLTTNILSHAVTQSSLPFKLDKSGDIIVTAPTAGTVARADYQVGSYVTGGTVMATLYNANNMYITGRFHLSPPDYTRLENGEAMDVIFPDDSTVEATVYSIRLEQDGSSVVTIVNARLPATYMVRPAFTIGTPVQASLRLTKATWWDDLTKAAHKVISPKAG